MNGTVKFFNAKKGYGFITSEDGKDYFVHISGVNGERELNDNEAVSFDVEDGERGPKAVNVSSASDSTSEEPSDSEEASDDDDSEE